MEALMNMTVAKTIEVACASRDPVEFAKLLLEHIGATLDEAIRAELTAREAAIKELRRDAKVLRLEFKH